MRPEDASDTPLRRAHLVPFGCEGNPRQRRRCRRYVQAERAEERGADDSSARAVVTRS